MSVYSIELTNRAKKQLAALDKKMLALVAALIDEISESEDPKQLPSAKKLQGIKNGWRWRTGTYRVLGTIDDNRIVIELFRVGHRREVYRRLGKA